MEKAIQELIGKYEKEALDGGRLYAYTHPYSSTVDILADLKRLLIAEKRRGEKMETEDKTKSN